MIYPAKKPAARKKSPRKPLKSGGRIRIKKRSASEYARIYGSKARVDFVKALPCVAATTRCIRQVVDNHHIKSGGTGRKAGYLQIVPLCNWHHRYLHVVGAKSFESIYGLDLQECAAETEAAWQVHINSSTEKKSA